jgi:hypothetical protein
MTGMVAAALLTIAETLPDRSEERRADAAPSDGISICHTLSTSALGAASSSQAFTVIASML